MPKAESITQDTYYFDSTEICGMFRLMMLKSDDEARGSTDGLAEYMPTNGDYLKLLNILAHELYIEK